MAQFVNTTCLAQVKEGREGSDEDADEVTGGIKRSSSDKKRKGDVSHLHPSSSLSGTLMRAAFIELVAISSVCDRGSCGK